MFLGIQLLFNYVRDILKTKNWKKAKITVTNTNIVKPANKIGSYFNEFLPSPFSTISNIAYDEQVLKTSYDWNIKEESITLHIYNPILNHYWQLREHIDSYEKIIA